MIRFLLLSIICLSFNSFAKTQISSKNPRNIVITPQMEYHTIINMLREGKMVINKDKNYVERTLYSGDRKSVKNLCRFNLIKRTFKGVAKCTEFKEVERNVKGKMEKRKIPSCKQDRSENIISGFNLSHVENLKIEKDDKKFKIKFNNEYFYFRSENMAKILLEKMKSFSSKNCQ